MKADTDDKEMDHAEQEKPKLVLIGAGRKMTLFLIISKFQLLFFVVKNWPNSTIL